MSWTRSSQREPDALRSSGFPGSGRTPTGCGDQNYYVLLKTIEYEFWGERFRFSVPAMFLLAFVVGVIGGTYGIGGGAIIAPFCVAVFHLPVYTMAGAALLGTFLTSIVGVFFTASCRQQTGSLLLLTGGSAFSSASAGLWACISAPASRNSFLKSSSRSCSGS
jgi:uncharacterized membrane protein YfcA